MNFVDAVKTCLIEKYCNFTGRARRSEFWFYCLFSFIAGCVAGFIDGLFGISLMTILVYLATLLPGLGVSVRRMHDIGKSGWTVLLSLIPIVGGIILIVFSCRDSQVGANEYGENPKGINVESSQF